MPTRGVGQVVDSAIYEAVLAMMESTVPEYTAGGFIRERSGAILPKTAPSNVYPTKSGDMIVMGANQDSVFTRLCDAMEQPQLARDARFADHVARGENQAELDGLISAWSATLDAEPLLAAPQRFRRAGRAHLSCAGNARPIRTLPRRRSIIDVPHPQFADLKMQDVFPRMSATQGTVRWPGPALGAHNDEIYGELLGLDQAARAALARDGII